MQVLVENPEDLPDNSYKQIMHDITEVHDKLCEFGFPYAISDATSKSHQAPYKTYFGSRSNHDPLRVLNAVADAIQVEGNVMAFYFRGPDCKKRDYAYCNFGTNKVILCPKFETAPKYTENNNHDTKFQTLAHEYTHIFAETKDLGYGYTNCRKWLSTKKAINNADSFGYYIQDVYDAKQ